MAANKPARAMVEDELEKVRTLGDFVKPNLAIHHPVTVYTARINQTFDSLDNVVEFLFDTGTGDLDDVLQHMTVFISGTAFGKHDKGICRIRQLPTSDTFYISAASDIPFANNDYVTVIDAFQLMPRDPTEIGGVILMDHDILFGDYTKGGAIIPRIGPLASVLELGDADSVDFHPLDPSLSECYDGQLIDSFLYAAPGASATANLDTTSPTFTYDTPGEYRWSCTVADDSGREVTAYRRLFVDPPEIDFTFEERPIGDYFTGYWEFTVRCFEGVTLDDVYDGALVTLYEKKAIYNGERGSLGPLAEYENFVVSGWVDGKTIDYDSESGSVTFQVQGPGFWLDKVRAFPFELRDVSAAATSWTEIEEMTVDKALAFLLFWLSTAPIIMDCFFTGNTTRLPFLSQPHGSLLGQITAMAHDTLFARPLVNRFGQLFVETDQQLLSSTVSIYASDRDDLPVVMEITKEDRTDGLQIRYKPHGTVGMVELSAYVDYDGSTPALVYSRAPGNIPKKHGEMRNYDSYLVTDQDECNERAGHLLAFENQEFDPLEIEFSSNNNFFDIAPLQYGIISVAEDETPLGITWTDKRLIPRRVELDYSEDGVCTPTITFEVETLGVDGVEYHPPVAVADNLGDFNIPDLEGVDIPGLDDFPPFVTPEVTTPCDSIGNSFSLGWSLSTLIGVEPTKLIARIYFPCKVRASAYYPTSIEMRGIWYSDAPVNYNVYGIKAGVRVLTASVTDSPGTNVASFSPLSDTEVDGFEIELEAGLGSPVSFSPGSQIGSGSVNAIDSTGATIALTIGEYYAIEGTGGPWDNGVHTPPSQYNFQINANGNVGYNGAGGNFLLSTPVACLASEQIGGSNYGRVYLLAAEASVTFRVGDTVFGDNAGTLGYILREAIVNGRRIQLGPAIIRNVCAP